MIDEAGAAQHLLPANKRRKTITTKEIETVVSKIARIPPKSVSKTDTEALRDLESNLKRVVFGQDAAIDALTSAIKLSRAGLREPEKPIGSYLFTGPDGRRQDRGGQAAGQRCSASSSSASTCPSTWRSTRSAG